MNELPEREEGAVGMDRGEHAMPADGPAARREHVLARARATIARVERNLAEDMNDPDRAARARRADEWQRGCLERKAEETARQAAELERQYGPVRYKRAPDRPGPAICLAFAEAMCANVWKLNPYDRENNGRRGVADLAGNCHGKSLFLQAHLGGVIITGRRLGKARKQDSRHGALLLPIDGTLYVADAGKVVPWSDYSRSFALDGIFAAASEG